MFGTTEHDRKLMETMPVRNTVMGDVGSDARTTIAQNGRSKKRKISQSKNPIAILNTSYGHQIQFADLQPRVKIRHRFGDVLG
jgi:hypothetical protein